MNSTACRLPLFLSLAIAASASAAAPAAKSSVPAPSPLQVESVEVKTKAGAKSLAGKLPLAKQQDFAVRLNSEKPLYLYVLQEHAAAPPVLFHPRLDSPLSPVSGKLRVPQRGDDWFFLEKIEPGDRLCLIGSERPLSQPSCKDEGSAPAKGRGEDSPPPSTERQTETPAPPPPPPDDKDPARGGRKKWVILFPLAAS